VLLFQLLADADLALLLDDGVVLLHAQLHRQSDFGGVDRYACFGDFFDAPAVRLQTAHGVDFVGPPVAFVDFSLLHPGFDQKLGVIVVESNA